MDVALYGGSFDPPHLGHVHVVTAALEKLDIGRLIIVPAFVNPFKTGTHAPAALRLSWLKEIFKDDDRVEVSDFEVRQNRPVRSIETVKHFSAIYDKIYFIIGADNLASLKKWYRYEELDKLVTWVVATRDKIEIGEHYIQLDVKQAISSTELRKNMTDEHLPTEVAAAITGYYPKKQHEENHARSH